MPVTIVETPTTSKTGSIFIRPYVDPHKDNLGLQNYNMALFDGIHHSEQLALIDYNGVRRYITGLNEFAPDVKLMPNKDQREAKIMDIRKTVAQLEKDLAANVIDPKDEEFWNKVKLLKPDNHDFWGKISLKCGNSAVVLNPDKDSFDLIKLYAIEAGGFSIVAKSYDDAQMMATTPKFYLDKQVDTISTKTEVVKLRNRALSELQDMFDKNTNKLFYVAKVIDANSAQYKRSTPNDIVYDNMDKYINGQAFEKSVKRTAKNFLDVSKLSMDALKIRAIIKDATFYKFIALKPDGFIYEMESGALMGRTPSECAEFLNSPLNVNIFTNLMERTEKYWSK